MSKKRGLSQEVFFIYFAIIIIVLIASFIGYALVYKDNNQLLSSKLKISSTQGVFQKSLQTFNSDSDNDRIINGNDPDANGDGIIDDSSLMDVDPNGDIDGDGIPNINDSDIDGDGLLNGNDPDANSDGKIESKLFSSILSGTNTKTPDELCMESYGQEYVCANSLNTCADEVIYQSGAWCEPNLLDVRSCAKCYISFVCESPKCLMNSTCYNVGYTLNDATCNNGSWVLNQSVNFASCSDGIQDGNETDVDCGGNCLDCANGKVCLSSNDCLYGNCTSGLCYNSSGISQPICGNNITEAGETCDDGNVQNGDGCSSTCRTEIINQISCTDSIKNGNETDVDCGGNCLDCANGKFCLSSNDCLYGNCTSGLCYNSSGISQPICGNNILETDEQCDDGNIVSGDGCSSICQTEINSQSQTCAGVRCSLNQEVCKLDSVLGSDICCLPSECASEGNCVSSGDIYGSNLCQSGSWVEVEECGNNYCYKDDETMDNCRADFITDNSPICCADDECNYDSYCYRKNMIIYEGQSQYKCSDNGEWKLNFISEEIVGNLLFDAPLNEPGRVNCTEYKAERGTPQEPICKTYSCDKPCSYVVPNGIEFNKPLPDGKQMKDVCSGVWHNALDTNLQVINAIRVGNYSWCGVPFERKNRIIYEGHDEGKTVSDYVCTWPCEYAESISHDVLRAQKCIEATPVYANQKYAAWNIPYSVENSGVIQTKEPKTKPRQGGGGGTLPDGYTYTTHYYCVKDLTLTSPNYYSNAYSCKEQYIPECINNNTINPDYKNYVNGKSINIVREPCRSVGCERVPQSLPIRYFKYSQSSDVGISNQLTIELDLTLASDNPAYILAKGTEHYSEAWKRDGGYFLYYDNHKLCFSTETATSKNVKVCTDKAKIGQMYKVTATYDGTYMKLYLNGMEVGSEFQSGGLTATRATIDGEDEVSGGRGETGEASIFIKTYGRPPYLGSPGPASYVNAWIFGGFIKNIDDWASKYGHVLGGGTFDGVTVRSFSGIHYSSNYLSSRFGFMGYVVENTVFDGGVGNVKIYNYAKTTSIIPEAPGKVGGFSMRPDFEDLSFSWGSVSNSFDYEFVYYNDADNVQHRIRTSYNNMDFSNVKIGLNYYFKVRACNANVCGDWSKTIPYSIEPKLLLNYDFNLNSVSYDTFYAINGKKLFTEKVSGIKKDISTRGDFHDYGYVDCSKRSATPSDCVNPDGGYWPEPCGCEYRLVDVPPLIVDGSKSGEKAVNCRRFKSEIFDTQLGYKKNFGINVVAQKINEGLTLASLGLEGKGVKLTMENKLCLYLVSNDNRAYTFCGDTQIFPLVWYELGATYDGEFVRLYVNGKEDLKQPFNKEMDYGKDSLDLATTYDGKNYLILCSFRISGTHWRSTVIGGYSEQNPFYGGSLGYIDDFKLYNYAKGNTCVRNSDCFSGSCVNNLCKPLFSGNEGILGSCGNGDLDINNGEGCDNGSQNGVPCGVSAYEGVCNFCTLQCQIATSNGPSCGDGIKNGPEECDNGAQNGMPCLQNYGSNPGNCTSYCRLRAPCGGGYCGDGILQSSQEQCDDGNKRSGDGCSNDCRFE